MHLTSVLGVLGVLSSLHAHVRAAQPFHRPTSTHQFASNTDKYLHVVWSVPADLAPFAGLRSSEELEGFIARSAVFLCREHRGLEPTRKKPFKLQIVRMNGSHESAAHGFRTVAELVLPPAHATDHAFHRALGLELTALKATFTSFVVRHDRMQLPAAPASA